jgi:hypothetical protein
MSEEILEKSAEAGGGVSGGIGSLSSQVVGEMGYSTQMSGLSTVISKQTLKAQNAGAVAGLGSSMFSAAGGFGTLFPGKGQGGGVPQYT